MLKTLAATTLPFFFSACAAGPILLEDIQKTEPDSLKFLFAVKTKTAIPLGRTETGDMRFAVLPPRAAFISTATNKIYTFDCRALDRMISHGTLGLALADAQTEKAHIQKTLDVLHFGHKSAGCPTVEA